MGPNRTFKSYPSTSPSTFGSLSAVAFVAALLWLSAPAAGQRPPVFEPISATTISVDAGSRLSIIARALDSTVQYVWLKDGSIISAASANPVFAVPSATKDHGGTYQCNATNAYGSTLSLPIDVRVANATIWQLPATSTVMVKSGYAAVVRPLTIDSHRTVLSMYIELNGSNSGSTSWFFSPTTAQLIVPQVTTLDNGRQFELTLYQNDGSIITAAYTLQIINDVGPTQPYFALPLPTSTVVVSGQNAVLECYPNARSAFMQWYFQLSSTSAKQLLSVVPTDPHYKFESSNARLTILRVSSNDSGIYTCEASVYINPPSTISSITQLFVQVQPTFTVQPPSDSSPSLGSNVMLPCLVAGVPQPNVTWFKDAKKMAAAVGSSSRYRIDSNGSLSLLNYSNSDNGNYQCFASNPAGTITAASHVRYILAPVITTRLPDTTVAVEGTNVMLSCPATGNPSPTITWQKDNQPLPVGSKYVAQLSQLIVVNTEVSDSAVYRCSAISDAGSDYSMTSLTVYRATSIVNSSSSPVELLKLSSASLWCVVRADARITPTIKWYKGSSVVTGPYFTLRDNNQTLYMQSVSTSLHGGNYSCLVTSIAGGGTRSFTVIITEVPYPPYITASLSAVRNRTIRLTWRTPYDGNKPILYFKLYQLEAGVQQWTLYPDQITSSATSLDVSSLTPSKTYAFKLLAVNAIGDGQESSVTENVTIPPEPPQSPPQLVVLSPRNTSLLLSFSSPEPKDWNGGLLGYYVEFRIPGVPWQRRTYLSSAAGPQIYLLDGMFPYQEYYIRLAAFNAQGTGPYTAEYRKKTLDGIPTEPPSIVSCTALSSTSVQVTWAPPSDPTSLNGEAQGYYVSIYSGNQPAGTAITVQTVNADVSQYQFSNLNKFTTYSFLVAVFTRGGSSPTSAPASATTLQDRPGSVANLTVLTVTHRSITVSWSLPASPNGIITGYFYDCQSSSGGDSVVNTAVDHITTSATCENLTSSTTYDVRVLAATIVGQGPHSAVRAQTLPPPELPGAVGQPSIADVGSRSASVRFAPGYDGKAPINAYVVQAQVGTSSSWSDIWVNSGSASSFDILRLQPYTRYVIRIVAQNIVGRGAASQPCTPFMTQQDAPSRAPGNVTARPRDATTVVITWSPLQPEEWNGPSAAYLVYYWPSIDLMTAETSSNGSIGGQAKVRNMPGAFTRAVVLDSLTPWTMYSLCVAASNQLYNGSCSPAVSSSTLEGVPSSSPTSITVTSINATAAVVSWGPVPASGANGVVLGYSLFYASQLQPSSGSVVELVAVIPSGRADGTVANQQYILPGLRPCETYIVRMAANTRAGRGSYSDPAATVLMPPADGTMPAPVNVYCPAVTQSAITVAWSPPPTACLVSGYTVTYWLSTNANDAKQRSLPASAGQLVITGLVALNNYVISVAAVGPSGGTGRAATLSVVTTTARSLPNAPVHVTVTSLTARSATVSWTFLDDPNAPVRNYTVYVRKSAVTATWTAYGDPVVAPSNEYQIVGLLPYTSYDIRLTASNDIGMSESSAVAVVRTPAAAPDAAPPNVQVVPVTSTALNVQWDDLSADQWNGQRDLFNVSFSLYWPAASDASNASGFMLASYPVRYVTVDGLLPGFVYEVRVAAVSNAGTGPQSLPMAVYVGVAVPTAQPTNVQVMSAGPTSIYVQWQGLTSDQLHGDLLGYKVYYKKVSGAEAAARTSRSAFSPTYDAVPPEAQQHVIVGLQEFATYAVVVAAYNLAGEGPYSGDTTVTTQTSAPGLPASITIVPVALAVANITWTPPTRPNGVITSYRVTYSLRLPAAGDGSMDRSSSSSSNVRQILVSNVEQCLLSSLSENATYSVSVAARTSAGWGNASAVDLSTSAAAGSPAKPFDVRFAQLTTTVTVSWTVVDSGRSPVTGYVVEALPKNGAADDWQLVERQLSTSPEAVLSSAAILGGQSFERLRVSVFNDLGVSPAAIASEGELPVYKQWWFLVMIALIALVIIVTIVAALCCECYKRRARKAKQAYSNHVFDSTEMRDEGLFSPEESRQSARRSSQRSQRSLRRGDVPLGPPPALSYVGSPHMGSTSLYSDEPPPHYEEDAGSSGGGSSTAKRSFSDDEADDDDYDDDVKKVAPSSDLDEEDGPARRGGGRGSAQAGFNHFQYAGGHYATPSVRKSWRDRQKATRNMYNYTDSEADSYYGVGGASRREPGSGYQSQPVPGMSSSGRVTLSDANVPGSRAPLPFFSSFV